VLQLAVPLIVENLQRSARDEPLAARLNAAFGELFSDAPLSTVAFAAHAPPSLLDADAQRSPTQQFQIRLRLFVAFVRAIVNTA
jgi:hypothetical protein